MAKNENVNIALNRLKRVCAFQKNFFLRSSLLCNFELLNRFLKALIENGFSLKSQESQL